MTKKDKKQEWKNIRKGSHVAVGEERPLDNNFRFPGTVKYSDNLGPLLTQDQEKNIEGLKTSLDSFNKIDIKEFNLDKPLVSVEEAQVIKDFFKPDFDKGAWIQTCSGKKFFPLDPKMEDIDLESVAHSLSMQCRFTGHSKFHYSIAQHSVLVSYLCDSADAKHGLLHDATEFVLNDIPTPLKKLPQFSFYKEAEKKLQRIIYEKFGLSPDEPPSVKKADLLALATEANTLLDPIHPEWKLPCTPLPVKIAKITPEQAKELFLNRFLELFGKDAI